MLALIPLVLAYSVIWSLKYLPQGIFRYLIALFFIALWLAFLPNTCYLLTEWRHFLQTLDIHDLFVRARYERVVMMRLMLMCLFYMAYSGFGMLCFALAIRPIERLVDRKGIKIWYWAFPFFVLLSLGVYLGLVLRFNSWDLWNNPKSIVVALLEIINRPALIFFIITFGVFLWAAYEAIDLWIDAFTEKLSKLTGICVHLGSKGGGKIVTE